MKRLDQEGPDGLIRPKVPVNRFPDFVKVLVQALAALMPTLGRRRIADLLTRVGRLPSAATVERMRKAPPAWPPLIPGPKAREEKRNPIVARYPGHTWHGDFESGGMSGSGSHATPVELGETGRQ